MIKTKTKIVKKETTEKVVENKLPKGEFNVYIKINDVVTNVDTNDIASVILASKPDFPKTTMTIRVTKGKIVRDRYLQLQEAKRLYLNPIALEVFIKNLLF